MFYIILIIICILVFRWLRKKIFSSKEEERINMHNKLKEENTDLYNEHTNNKEN